VKEKPKQKKKGISIAPARNSPEALAFFYAVLFLPPFM
jgi:hypothetical protein